MNVAANLFEYLKKNDKAELTGFGTFFIITYSAEFDADCNVIAPPKRVLNFSKETANDMSFVSFMAKSEFISEQTALTWVKQYSDSLNERLNTTKNFILPSLGTISVDESEHYFFEPLPLLNLMDESFGLDIVKNVKTFEPSEPEASQEIEESEKQKEITIDEVVEQPKDYTSIIVSKLATEEESDDIEQLVEDIRAKVDRILYLSQKNEEQSTDEKTGGARKKQKSLWKSLFVLILILSIGAFTTIGSYYMGWLQNYQWAKPISKILSQYMATKDEINHKFEAPKPAIQPNISIADSTVNNLAFEQPSSTLIVNNSSKSIQTTRKKEEKKDTIVVEKEEKKAPADFTGAIQIRQTNKLGYDVIANTVNGKIKAENDARKAKSLGYDGYIITRQRKNTPVYYVSYGSRSTLNEAKDLMQSMIDSLGGNYYIVVRGETIN